MGVSATTAGFIDILEEISHDPDDYDEYDLREYIETVANPARVLKEFALWVHENYL